MGPRPLREPGRYGADSGRSREGSCEKEALVFAPTVMVAFEESFLFLPYSCTLLCPPSLISPDTTGLLSGASPVLPFSSSSCPPLPASFWLASSPFLPALPLPIVHQVLISGCRRLPWIQGSPEGPAQSLWRGGQVPLWWSLVVPASLRLPRSALAPTLGEACPSCTRAPTFPCSLSRYVFSSHCVPGTVLTQRRALPLLVEERQYTDSIQHVT